MSTKLPELALETSTAMGAVFDKAIDLTGRIEARLNRYDPLNKPNELVVMAQELAETLVTLQTSVRSLTKAARQFPTSLELDAELLFAALHDAWPIIRESSECSDALKTRVSDLMMCHGELAGLLDIAPECPTCGGSGRAS